MTKETICVNCMEDTGGAQICPHCGFNRQEPQKPHALPYRTVLQGRYLVGRAVEENGEGIRYTGMDLTENTRVLIREFFPETLAQRGENGTDVQVMGGSEVLFNETIAQFLSDSRELAHRRELSAIFPVYDIFEENKTAYTVLEGIDGVTLRAFIEESGGRLSWETARPLFMPVLNALSQLHAAGLSHLGISPDTLYVVEGGKMKLGGFCIRAVRRMGSDLPPDLVAGCAALEQYVADFPLGEPTDVYGFAATLFFALTGTLPKDSLQRRGDPRLLIPSSIVRALPQHVISALANALQVAPERRTPTFERMRAELSAAPTAQTPVVKAPESSPSITRLPPVNDKEKHQWPAWATFLLTFAVSMLVLFGGYGVWSLFQPAETQNNETSDVSSQVSELEESSMEESTVESGESSLSENQIEAPNVVGQDYESLAESTGGDYTVMLSGYEFSDDVNEGQIISQSPLAGDPLEKGGVIVVVVSQGPQKRTLPGVAGDTLATACEKLTEAGFVPVASEEYSDSVPEGSVIGYANNESGDTLDYGSQVTIRVSLGKDPAADS